MWRAIRQFMASDDGPTSVEYAIMLALIIVVCISGILVLSGNLSNSMTNSATEIQTYVN